MHILLIEDHRLLASATRSLLQHGGYSVTIANDAGKALELCNANRFDLVLCDIRLPDMNGWDLMKKLKESYGLNGIALTSCAYSADAERSAEAGFIAHLTKPVEPARLLQSIAEAGDALRQRPCDIC